MMDRFAIVDTYYWWLTDHHEGQGSRKYARLSRLSRIYTPGAMRRGAEDVEGYNTLCDREGCTHEQELSA